jgi:hypothetical protein
MTSGVLFLTLKEFDMKYKLSLIAFAALTSVAAQAADWSDTSLTYRHGSKFAEPDLRAGGECEWGEDVYGDGLGRCALLGGGDGDDDFGGGERCAHAGYNWPGHRFGWNSHHEWKLYHS